MAKTLDYHELTPADELRRYIVEAEEALGRMRRSDSSSALDVLHGLDKVHELLPSVEARGVDLRSENTRIETLHAGVRNRASIVVRALRGLGGIEDLRLSAQADETRWWWFLDRDLKEKRQHTVRRWLVIALIVLAAGIVLAILYNRYLRPDPSVVKAYELLLKGESLAAEGEFAAALDRFDEALLYRPDEPDLIVWNGVLRQQLGDPDVTELWERAESLLESEAVFLVQRGQTYMGVGRPDLASSDAISALEIDPNMGEAYLLLGAAHEAQGNRMEAIASYEQASHLADDAGDHELSALARMRMAMLLQQVP